MLGYTSEHFLFSSLPQHLSIGDLDNLIALNIIFMSNIPKSVLKTLFKFLTHLFFLAPHTHYEAWLALPLNIPRTQALLIPSSSSTPVQTTTTFYLTNS